MIRRFAITGATGFLGSALADYGATQGAELVLLARQPPAQMPPSARFVSYNLQEEAPPTAAFAGCSAVVHCAYDLSVDTGAYARNVTATRALRRTAREAGARFVFVSSMSAHAQARSAYGRSKWESEQTLDPDADTIVKPGLIVGPGGLYTRIRASLLRLPFVPLFYGGRQPIQPIALGDLVSAIWRLMNSDRAGLWALGTPTPVPLANLYRRILEAHGRRAHFVRLPGGLTLRCLQLAEQFRLPLPVTSDNLLGLKHLQTFDVGPSLRDLGLELTPLDRFPWI